MNKIAQKGVLTQVRNAQQALDMLNGNGKPQAILVADAGVASRVNNDVIDKLIEYVRGGGIVVLAGSFSSSIRPSDMCKYSRKWNLPWKNGSYCRTTVHLNRSAEGVPRSGLPASYSQKALFLTNVDNNAAWYLPNEHSRTESHVFSPEPVPTSETPAAFAKVGNGWLGYIGDVNGEEETDAVLLGMLGLA
ncbi:hypothetical protein PV08_08215 [Exophiala spinifera]|uniref:Uncharacterized protein n=1 Tax=Exophiala spinifera TaxID=91928 RepID=A0A0D2B2C8_9EURO|nr:uncharacterized protein PV08_08215 [Exophiala spinifera]KIW13028.1 hypothetical protein PV08_08215 [Exophiala spinifera]